MNGFTRRGATVAIATAAAVALLGLAGCARSQSAGTPTDEAGTTDLGWAGQALQAIGVDTADLAPAADITDDATVPNATDINDATVPNDATPSPTSTAKAGGKGGGAKNGLPRRHRLLRFAFGKGTLHAEGVVKTEDGTKTVAVQRGTVTAIDAKSVTVKSTDGFSMTWTFGTPITVIERRSQVQPSAIAVGTTVGIAGEKSGSTSSARLIVVPRKS